MLGLFIDRNSEPRQTGCHQGEVLGYVRKWTPKLRQMPPSVQCLYE